MLLNLASRGHCANKRQSPVAGGRLIAAPYRAVNFEIPISNFSLVMVAIFLRFENCFLSRAVITLVTGLGHSFVCNSIWISFEVMRWSVCVKCRIQIFLCLYKILQYDINDNSIFIKCLKNILFF